MRKCIFIFLGFWEFCLYISLYELFFIYADSFIISISEQHHRLLVTCSHHLNPRFWSGGFLLNDSTEPSIYKLSSRVPRFFLPGHGRIFLLIVRIQTVYAVPLPTFFHFFEKSCLFHLNLFFHKKQFFFDLLSCRLFLLYHESRWRTSVLSCFFAIHLPPVEEGEFLLYIMLNFWIPQTWSC